MMSLNRYFIVSILLLTNLGLAFSQIQPSGGGEIRFDTDNTVPCYTPEQEAIMVADLKAQIAALRSSGIIKESINRSSSIPGLSWPMRQAEGSGRPGYYVTINFVDQDTSDGILDYNCGNRTYDGHNGSDYSLWPFWWDMMEEERGEIIAAAPGTIIQKYDNNYDSACDCSSFYWNAVYIMHDDGSTAWYGHMKTGSLTSKAIGETVERGEYLGLIGSSGCSSNPHLHFEIRDDNFNVVDPYDGSCNPTVTESLWLNQKPYREPGLCAILTHSSFPSNGQFCPENEHPYFQNQFDVGERVYFSINIQDQEEGDTLFWAITYPNGDTLYSNVFISPGTYSSSWWVWNYFMPNNAFAVGKWNWKVLYKGELAVHPFTMGCPDMMEVDEPTVLDDTYLVADEYLYSTGSINVLSAPDGAVFQAGDSIRLNPNFEVAKGSSFEAKVGGCP